MKFKLAAACFVIGAALAPVAFAADSDKPSTFVKDSVITTKVKAAFAADPLVKATEVKVETFKGTVQLSGFVQSRESADRAVQLAREVKGVKAVKNDTVIK